MLRRTAAEREPLLRLEGQERGLQQMIEDDRYRLDELQQASAIGSALQEVAIPITSQHLAAGLLRAGSVTGGAPPDIEAVPRAALRQV